MNLPLPTNLLSKFPSDIGSSFVSLDPSTMKAVLAIGFVFVVFMLVGLSRRLFLSTSLQGVWSGFVMGMIVLFLVEGIIFWVFNILIVGKDAEKLPQNLRVALLDSKENITQVLGAQTKKSAPTAADVMTEYKLLTPIDATLVKNSVCIEEKNK